MIGLRLDTSGVPAFLLELELELARFEREISLAFRNWTFKMFTDLVKNTPQWSGDLAANWKYTTGAPSTTYSAIPNKSADGDGNTDDKLHRAGFWSATTVYARGAEPAVGMALAQLESVKPTWRDVVYFANNTPIADKVSRHVVRLRPVNLIGMNTVFMLDHLVHKAESGAYVP